MLTVINFCLHFFYLNSTQKKFEPEEKKLRERRNNSKQLIMTDKVLSLKRLQKRLHLIQ